MSNMTVKVPVMNGSNADVAGLAIAALQKEGYTVTGVKVTGSEFELTASKGNVSGYVFTTDTDVYYEVAVAAGELR
jgi:hypothetical protein